MARVLKGISQLYLHTPRSFANGINRSCLASFPAEVGPHLPSTDPEGTEGRVGLGGWLHMSVGRHISAWSTVSLPLQPWKSINAPGPIPNHTA